MRRIHRVLVGTTIVIAVILGGVGVNRGRVAAQAGQSQGPSAATAAVMKDAIFVDGHVHITELAYHQGIDPWKAQPTGLFDYARAKQGGLNVVVHAVYTIDGYNQYNYGVKHALRLIEKFYENLEANKDKMELALTSADVRRIVKSGKMAAILAIEGNPDMEGDLDVLRMWHRLGVRMIQLTSHNSTNALIDAETDQHIWGGISDKGRAFIKEMNRLGIIVDPSHSTEEAHLQVIQASQAPIADSHASYPTRPDQHTSLPQTQKVLKALAAKNGLVAMIQSAISSKPLEDWAAAHPSRADSGMDASGVFLSRSRRSTLRLPNEGIRPPEEAPKDRYGAYITALDAEVHDEKLRRTSAAARADQYGTPWRDLQAEDEAAGMPAATPADWADHASSVVELIGDDHVGIGLDLMAKPAMRNWDATKYWALPEALLGKGMSPASVKKILGENWLRVLDQAKVPGIAAPGQ